MNGTKCSGNKQNAVTASLDLPVGLKGAAYQNPLFRPTSNWRSTLRQKYPSAIPPHQRETAQGAPSLVREMQGKCTCGRPPAHKNPPATLLLKLCVKKMWALGKEYGVQQKAGFTPPGFFFVPKL